MTNPKHGAGMPLSFSISVPVGAYHDFLPANFASLACQDVDLRVSLLDASGDPRVTALAEAYPDMIAYRRHGPDEGQSDAIIEGWTKTPGDILGWLNADDILMPGALKRVAERLETEPSLDMLYGHSVILDSEGRMVGYHWAVEPPGPRIFEAGVISQPSCFFRRTAYDKAGGLDRNLHYTMDWDLWVRLYNSGAEVGFIDAPLSMVLWGDETKTASFNVKRQGELKRIIESYAPPDRRKKIFRSFAINSMMGRVKLDALRKALERFLHRKTRPFYGLRADGRIESAARLYLAHYEDAPKERVLIALQHKPRGENLSASEPLALVEETKQGLVAAFEKPVEAGRTVELDLSAPPGRRTYFHYCKWL